jgi:hypothetical protein
LFFPEGKRGDMVKSDDILMLGLVGIGGYVAYQLVKPIQQTAEEIGQGVGGLVYSTGSGLSQPFLILQTAGQAGQDIIREKTTEYIQTSQREFAQSNETDISAYNQIKDKLANLQATTELNKAENKSNQSILVQDEVTQWVKRITTADDKITSAISTGLKVVNIVNPTNLVSSLITATADKVTSTYSLSGGANAEAITRYTESKVTAQNQSKQTPTTTTSTATQLKIIAPAVTQIAFNPIGTAINVIKNIFNKK